MEKEYEAYLEEKAQADPAIWLDGPNSEAARAARGEGSFVHDVLVRLYLQHIADHLDRLVLETLKP